MERSLFLILTISAIVIETVFTPLFLHYQRPGICLKSFLCKMTCASMFLAIAIISYIYSGNDSEFATFMLIGLSASWVGDLFLHVKKGSRVTFGIGMAFFAAAHVLYLISYAKATAIHFPDSKFLTIPEILAAVAIIAILYVVINSKAKFEFGAPIIIAFVVYGLILATMFVKAASFGIQYIMAGNSVFAGLCLAFGGALFFCSDITLVILMINEKLKKNYRLKDFNIASYFIAQTLLALSVLNVGLI